MLKYFKQSRCIHAHVCLWSEQVQEEMEVDVATNGVGEPSTDEQTYMT